MNNFSRFLRILLPEIQLLDYLNERGWRGDKDPVNIAAPTVTLSNGGIQFSAAPDYGPTSVESVKEVIYDARRGVKSLTLNRSPKDLDDIFAEITGELNKRIIGQEEFIQKMVAVYKKAFIASNPKKVQNTILLTGPEGTGKKKTLSLLIDQMYKKRLISYDRYIIIDLSQYSEEEIHTNFINDFAAAFRDGTGTVCFTGIDSVHIEIQKFVSQLLTEGYFRTVMGSRIDAAGYFLICYYDTDIYENIKDQYLPNTIAAKIHPLLLKGIKDFAITKPLTAKHMEQILKEKLALASAKITKQAQLSITYADNLCSDMSARIFTSNSYGVAINNFVENDFLQVIFNLRAKGELVANQKIEIRLVGDTLSAVTIDKTYSLKLMPITPPESIDSILAELEKLIGLKSVKKFVYELLDTVRVQQKRLASGQKEVSMTLHMAFTGNPGTGKTTVARLISRVLRSVGLLKQGQLIEVTRQDLVGEYVGSTAPKTAEKFTMADGGVLFIDEAYTLARDNFDIFGTEAIDTLAKAMEEKRSETVVILAGYTKEMEQFFKVNPGFRSRVPFIVEFPDYTPEEMLEILKLQAESRNYKIDPNVEVGLIELFSARQIPGKNDSGNGRLVRNIFEEAIRRQSTRLSEGEHPAEEWKILRASDFNIDNRIEFNIESALDKIVGLDNIKNIIRDMEKQMQAAQIRKNSGILVDTTQSFNSILLGNPGTGKTTVARLLANIMKSVGLLKKGHLVEADRTSLISEFVGQTSLKTKELVESALGGVLFIDEAYSLIDDNFGREAIDTLVRMIEEHRENLMVILAGYTEEMKLFMKMNPGLSSRFPQIIEFPDYSSKELAQITKKIAQAKGFTLGPEVPESLIKLFDKKQIPGKKDNGNGRLARNILEVAIRKQSVRITDQPGLSKDELTTLTVPDFQPEVSDKKATALEELEQVVGLQQVKDFVRTISAQIEVAKRRKELGLPDSGQQTLHMVFKGNPGTGKTTIARILAKRFTELGVIKTGHLTETDRSGLIAGYVGQTTLKTREVIENALGGVLFIDEAYALVEDDYGKEAIDVLVKAMDDYRDQLIVVLAGYDKDMDKFLEANDGLKSRFSNIINFPDYTPEEMLQISRVIYKSKGYKATEKAEEAFIGLCSQKKGDKNFGNGRFVRNLCEASIRNHALRVSQIVNSTAEQLSTIEAEDLKAKDIYKDNSRRIGFAVSHDEEEKV